MYIYIYNAINCGLFFFVFSISPSLFCQKQQCLQDVRLKDRREREEKLQEKNQKAKADKAQDLRGKKIFGGCFLFRRRWNAALVSGVGLCNIYL